MQFERRKMMEGGVIDSRREEGRKRERGWRLCAQVSNAAMFSWVGKKSLGQRPFMITRTTPFCFFRAPTYFDFTFFFLQLNLWVDWVGMDFFLQFLNSSFYLLSLPLHSYYSFYHGLRFYSSFLLLEFMGCITCSSMNGCFFLRETHVGYIYFKIHRRLHAVTSCGRELSSLSQPVAKTTIIKSISSQQLLSFLHIKTPRLRDINA